ncbi:hypothetical protein [Nitrobacter sp.]|uniref:hypothetical protein n=1 Tax=Nitrobacter sp. TaxID=29420 RepID=UPI002612FCE8|nr:hypothetical protein [Nitrobacter sp.]
MPKANGILFDNVAVNGGEYVGPGIAGCAWPGRIQAAKNATRPVDPKNNVRCFMMPPTAFSNEVDTGSREENASNQNLRAPLLIQSEAERLSLAR